LGAPPVVLVNESLARRYWPGEDALGKRIRGPGQEPWMTIVGVVGPARFASLGDANASAFFRPLAQSLADQDMSLVVRSRRDPRAIAASLRAVVASIDPDTPVSDIRPMRELITASLARPRFATVLLVTFGLLAMALGGVGIYGVIAYTVSQRTAEIALRMALGAHAADVVSLVVRHGAALTAAGVVVGLAAAAALTRVMSSLLYGVRPLDGATFAAAPMVIVVIALAACWVPARRAARTSPMDALRGDASPTRRATTR
jgi:predicted lysophospholipase L1 biosynthesis ABC-type transport system permease subunit